MMTMRGAGRAGIVGLVLLVGSGAVRGADPPLDFDRDIRPILSETCFTCHGPDAKQRKAELRLDLREGLFRTKDDVHVVVAAKPDDSELVRRIEATDDDVRMPPKGFAKQLTAPQKALVRRWVAEGAAWQGHWAFRAPQKPAVPAAPAGPFVRDDIDRFVLAGLAARKTTPSPEADRVTLIRRLSFDLRGLPPTPDEVDAFVGDRAADAYEKLVDRLLATPQYGERMAQHWLDVVRFADTGGYHSDNPRDVWLYRDWVIEAFAKNMPFDKFAVRQVAGDLLPDATRDDVIASGYNRLLQTTEEGGAQAKEYTAKYASDRVRNLGTAWLGLTTGCCECHDHKYDPLTMRDFYSLGAFFADVQEKAVGRQTQTPLPTPEQTARRTVLVAEQAAADKALDEAAANALPAWEQRAKAALDAQPKPDIDKKPDAAKQPDIDKPLAANAQPGADKPIENEKKPDAKPADPKAAAKPAEPAPPKEIVAILQLAADQRNDKQQAALLAHVKTVAPETADARKRQAAAKEALAAHDKAVPTSLVSQTGPPRMMRILARGNWLDDSGEVVGPQVPAVFGAIEIPDRAKARLALAQWLVRPDHPLVSRVFVNRVWKLLLGRGLVRTADDFGAQGTFPTHPELLDHLAVGFVASGWDVRGLVRRIVLSGTYRQSSDASPERLRLDPHNAFLARQGRFRLDAEFVRDGALAVSGLLVDTVGGPSTKPYQPDGYWQHLNFPKRTYAADTGPNQYRRGLYTFWQRSFPQPSLLAFDAPSREECTVDRTRSNNPLQALVLLNDPTYVEAARALAERVLLEPGDDTRARLARMSRLVLSRPPRAEELPVLEDLLATHRAAWATNVAARDGFLTVGFRPVRTGLDRTELAAWTSVARVYLNLHETIVRR